MKFNTKVSLSSFRKTQSPEIGKLMVEQRKAKREKAMEAHLDILSAKHEIRREQQEIAKSIAYGAVLENVKRKAMNKVTKLYPLLIAAEAYTLVTSNALPQDKEYVNENFSSILGTQFLYLYKLGGINYIKEQAIKENSSFLKGVVRVATENSRLITPRKIKEIQDAKNEDEVRAAMQLDLTEDESDKISTDINKLNTEELSNLLQKKVIQVVKDESKREEDNLDFIKELQFDVDEYEESKKDKEGSDEEPEAGKESDEDLTKNVKESSLSAIAKISKYILEKRATKESSLFFAMMQNNLQNYSKLKQVYESNNIKEDPTILTSPLNLNMMDVYLKDTSGDLADIDFLNISNNDPIGGDNTGFDEDNFELESSFETVLSETITQYTILECAFTTKLINVTTSDVRKYSNKLMGI